MTYEDLYEINEELLEINTGLNNKLHDYYDLKTDNKLAHEYLDKLKDQNDKMKAELVRYKAKDNMITSKSKFREKMSGSIFGQVSEEMLRKKEQTRREMYYEKKYSQ